MSGRLAFDSIGKSGERPDTESRHNIGRHAADLICWAIRLAVLLTLSTRSTASRVAASRHRPRLGSQRLFNIQSPGSVRRFPRQNTVPSSLPKRHACRHRSAGIQQCTAVGRHPLGTPAPHPSYVSDQVVDKMRQMTLLMAALLLAPLGPAEAATSVTRIVKVTKTVTVRTITTRKIVRTVTHSGFRHTAYGVRRYGVRSVVFVRRIHPESCFLPPDLVVGLDALGPYCDSPRRWHQVVVRY